MRLVNTSMVINIVYSLVAIMACLYIGKLTFALFGGLPASLYGMIFLNILLSLRIINQERISETFAWAIRHMGVCFVPAGVGIINHFDLLRTHGVFVVAIIFFTTFALITFVGLTVEKQQKLHHDSATIDTSHEKRPEHDRP